MASAVQMLVKVVNGLKNVPPVSTLRRIDHNRRFTNDAQANLFRGVFPTFAAAAASAPPTKKLGYDQPGPAAMYKDRLHRIYPADYPMVAWLLKVLTPKSRVFDFGGHIGVAYYAYERYLEYGAELRWTSCDVPAVIAEGATFARTKGATRLGFTSDFADADGSDVLIAAGSLQYVEPPLAKLLAPLARKPAHVLVNKFPLHDRPTVYTLQSIGTAFCPYAVVNRREFVGQMAALGYELVDEWQNVELACQIPFHPEDSVPAYSGLYFRLAGRP